MEINYEIIIKYLCNKTTKSNDNKIQQNTYSFVTQKNIYTYANTFPEYFKTLLSEKFYRYGITTHDNDHNNISFWISIITLLDKNFLIPYTFDEISMVNQFKNQMVNSYDKNKLSDFIRKLDKNDIRERFKINPDLFVIQYISNILDINIWIFNFNIEKINVVYPKDIMNPWKQSIFLANYNIEWEPIMCLKSKGSITRLFDFNHINFKKIMYMNDITYLDGDKINKKYIYMDNINDVIQQEKKILGFDIKNLLIDDNESDSSVCINKTEEDTTGFFIKNDELDEIKQLNKTKINKMKVSELTDLTKKLNIVISKQNPTKSILIMEIMNKLDALTNKKTNI
jgi:hypothetical protein